MANLTIQQPEIVFLQDAVIRKYCELTRIDPLQFRRSLTGTMKHYTDIAENILDHLDSEHLRAYTAAIGDGPFRSALRRLLEDEARSGKSKDSHWRPIVTDNVVRKLLFTDAEKQPELTFKDFFVVAFYVYIGVDRTDALQQLNQPTDPTQPTTPPQPTGSTSPTGPTQPTSPTPPTGSTPRPSQTQSNPTIRPDQSTPIPSNNNTIDPFRNKLQCTLRPLDPDSNPGEPIEFTYSGSPIILNRQNLDPQNNTITSKVQAQLSVRDGQWIIENFSELKTTYIKVQKPISIQKGDILIFGNRQFIVE